ncbi:MAG: 5'-nucleotidase C-terminal domain-containing protein [Bacteroidaceae bacterium]|nr:5'-nucleotidase C-terminal domain-containing protein [Bacteroidaceae bacterium]
MVFLLALLLVPCVLRAQKSISSERIEVTAFHDLHPNTKAMSVIAPYKVAVDSVMAPIVGRSLVAMSSARPESLLSNWAADVLVECSDYDGGKCADLGIINIGGLRSNMPKGLVRRGDILLISPFQNRLNVLYFKGDALLELMNDIASTGGEGVSREVRMRITADKKLVDVTVSGQPIDPERIYRVATLDYLAEGNDGLVSMKKAQQVKGSDLMTRDCMVNNIQRKGVITSQMEGRITIVENP